MIIFFAIIHHLFNPNCKISYYIFTLILYLSFWLVFLWKTISSANGYDNNSEYFIFAKWSRNINTNIMLCVCMFLQFHKPDVYWINMKHNIFLHQIQKYLHFGWHFSVFFCCCLYNIYSYSGCSHFQHRKNTKKTSVKKNRNKKFSFS